MNSLYYTLRWRGNLRTDEHLIASENTVRLGQKEDCDVRLPNGGAFADELFAVIRPARSEDGWQIIPVSEFVKTFVNGCPAGLTHYLKSGDRISFSEGGSEIVFEVRSDGRHGPETLRYSSVSRRLAAILYSSAAVIVAAALLAVFSGHPFQRMRTRAAMSAAKASVYRIQVDSVVMERITSEGTAAVERHPVRNSTIGTAFVTASGDMVTARHCIEPWLNNDIFNADLKHLPAPLDMALRAETYNQTHSGDTVYRVVSRGAIYDRHNVFMRRFSSSEFRYDDSRDEIVPLGDFYEELYWRSISGSFNRTDMMFDDIAVQPGVREKGSIRLATEEQTRKWINTESQLRFVGFPVLTFGGLSAVAGDVQKDYQPGAMISHSGALTQGYSGGPAIIINKGRPYAVGVISTLDYGSDKCIYSVPVTEINHLLQ